MPLAAKVEIVLVEAGKIFSGARLVSKLLGVFIERAGHTIAENGAGDFLFLVMVEEGCDFAEAYGPDRVCEPDKIKAASANDLSRPASISADEMNCGANPKS